MVDKIFGSDFTNEANPTGTMTLSINNGTVLVDVLLSDLYKALGTGTPSSTKYLNGAGAWVTVEASASWTIVPGTPTRVSNTQLTITDTGNAGLYDLLLGKGTVLKWTNSGVKMAMVSSASYSSNTVTINLVGDVLAAGFTDMKYFSVPANVLTFLVPGTISATGTNVSFEFYSPYDMKVFSADIRLGTAGSGTTTVDINDDGTTMFTTKPSITTTNTSDLDNTADDGIVAAEDSKLTVDLDAVAGTAGVDLYVYLYFIANKVKYIA